MARFQFGKGKKKSYWDVEQFGRILRTQETGGQSDMLPGFRTFADSAAARSELERLATERIEKGFTAADDDARAIADTVAKPDAPPPPAPTLPIRKDLHIYNEANGFMVLSMSMGGSNLDDGSKEWNKAVTDGKMIPIMLFQDDPFIVRVVAGQSLSSQEEEEWVARVDWWLDIPDGKLAVTGGAVLVYEDYDPEDPYYESYLGVVEVPAGRYRVSVYTYIPGVNGNAVIDHLAGGYEKGEPAGRWFRRTQPGTEFPAWLRDWCAGDPSTDPDHADEWKSAKRPDDSEIADLVHFLVHLTPDPSATGDRPSLDGGWFGEAEGGRKPERCPLGLVAHDVIRREQECPAGWIYVHDVFGKADRFACAPVTGDAVEVQPGDIANIARLACFSHGFSATELRVTLPEGTAFEPPDNVPADVLVLSQGGIVRIAFSNNIKPVEIIQKLVELAPVFAALPEGSTLEMSSSQLDERALEEETPIGTHRYRGPITAGAWRIEETFPKLAATTLRGALALSREVAAGDAISISNETEGKAVMKWAEGNHGIWIEDNPGTIADGRLTLGQREPKVLALYGSAAFAVRFGDTWRVLNLADDEDEDDEEEEGDMAIPVQGRKVLETPGGRMYFVTMALMVSEELAEKIMSQERSLKARGFVHVGDLVCNLFPRIAVRGYTKDGGDTWAAFLVAAPDVLVFEFSTRFARDDASLLTTRKPDATDDNASHSYRQSIIDGTIVDMLERHEARKAELSARYGPPVRTERTHASFAEAIEAALKKQLGG